MCKFTNPIIAVVDSGIGGVSILNQLIKENNGGNYIYFADNMYMPYGNKRHSFISRRIEAIIKLLKSKYHADYVIVACNTASSCLDANLTNIYTMKFDKKYTYLATPLTKKRLTRFKVIEDKNLASSIEKNIFNQNKLKIIVKKHIQKLKLYRYKTIVLGCTHYELVQNIFSDCLPNTNILLNSAFMLPNLTAKNNTETNIKILLSKQSEDYKQKILQLVKK